HQCVFIVRQRTCLGGNALGNENLPYVVYPAGVSDLSDILVREAKAASKDFGIPGDHFAVAEAVGFACFSSGTQSLDRFPQHVDVALFVSTTKLLECRDQDFEVFRTTVIALQEALDKAGNHGSLDSRRFSVFKFLGSRNAIAPSVLGDIHASISDTNQILDLEAVHGKARNAETSRDVVLAEHRIRSDP